MLTKGEDELTETATGDGPVHAACMAIERITGITGRLSDFSIRATTPGKDAMGEANVTVIFEENAYYGNAASTDIIEAAVHAYLNAVNKFLALKSK